MKTLKRLVHFFSDILLRFLVYATVLSLVFLIVFGGSGHVKYLIESSGAYQKFVPSIIESNKENTSIPLDSPAVNRVINESFPSKDLQLAAETIIEATYAWLEGDVGRVEFSLDFTDNKEKLGDDLSEYAFTELAFKDTCRDNPKEFDPFTSPCRPANYDIFEGQKEFAKQIKSSDGFLGKTILTQDDLPKNKSGKSVFEQYPFAPRVFRLLKIAPYILAAATILCACAYVWSADNRRKAVHRLGRGIAGNSVTLIVSPFVFGYLLPWLTKGYKGNLEGSSAEVLLNDIVETVTREFDRLLIWFGSVLLLIGIAIILAERMTRRRMRYSGVDTKSGMQSSNELRQISSEGRLSVGKVPVQSSEESKTKKPKARKKNSKYKKIPL
jgi:hypothetical protein